MPSHTESEIRRRIRARLLALPPRAFELFAGDLLTFVGLRDVSVTRYSGDGGIDAFGNLELSGAPISIPTGVQVKRHRANVGRADIDRFIGALSGHYPHGIFITTSSYSPQAALKARGAIPRVAMLDGDQVADLMIQHRLGVVDLSAPAEALDEEYFGQFEAQAEARRGRVAEPPTSYEVVPGGGAGLAPGPEEDLVSLRALSHALRVDAGPLRRRIEQGLLRPDQVAAPRGYFFRRDRIEAIRAQLLGRTRPAHPDAWRREFLEFARSRNLSKSYKPVLLKALLALVNRDGEVRMDALVAAFRAFYLERRRAGLPVEYGPPDLTDTRAVNDARLRQLIVKNPLERFLIKGFLEYLPDEGVVRFAPQLWAELRFWELLDLQRSADEQLAYYYARPRSAT
jgi:hypothetical protein